MFATNGRSSRRGLTIMDQQYPRRQVPCKAVPPVVYLPCRARRVRGYETASEYFEYRVQHHEHISHAPMKMTFLIPPPHPYSTAKTRMCAKMQRRSSGETRPSRYPKAAARSATHPSPCRDFLLHLTSSLDFRRRNSDELPPERLLPKRHPYVADGENNGLDRSVGEAHAK